MNHQRQPNPRQPRNRNGNGRNRGPNLRDPSGFRLPIDHQRNAFRQRPMPQNLRRGWQHPSTELERIHWTETHPHGVRIERDAQLQGVERLCSGNSNCPQHAVTGGENLGFRQVSDFPRVPHWGPPLVTGHRPPQRQQNRSQNGMMAPGARRVPNRMRKPYK